MPSYTFERLSDTALMVHEQELSYKMTQTDIERDIAALKANKRAYTNETQYLESLNLLESALKLLKEEQS